MNCLSFSVAVLRNSVIRSNSRSESKYSGRTLRHLARISTVFGLGEDWPFSSLCRAEADMLARSASSLTENPAEDRMRRNLTPKSLLSIERFYTTG